MMHMVETAAGSLLHADVLGAVPGVVHGFGARGIEVANYLDALGVKDRFIVRTNQMHGDVVHYLAWPKKGGVLEGDAFITDRPGMVCFVRTADCVPILIADTERPAIAAIHAGWRGTAKDIVGEAIRALHEVCGTRAEACVAAVGPRICGACYEVGPEVIAAMEALDAGDGWRRDGRRVDLGEANRAMLLRAGLVPSNVAVLPQCTSCDPTFASWRRDRSESERQFNFLVVT